MLVAGLFAGIGGFELGFERAGHRTVLLCENDGHAVRILRRQWPGVSFHSDIATLEELPKGTEIVTAGFPCQNLSIAGDKKGIRGQKTGVVDKLFDVLDRCLVPSIVMENVYFMLHLRQGAAMESIAGRLEQRGYRWAYRVVNSRAFGLAQRRRRVFIVASRSCDSLDPRDVLLADEAEEMSWPKLDMAHPLGFYWTEGRKGHGLTAEAIPPLKAGSSRPPAVLLPSGRVVTPTIDAVEQLQGFPKDWTSALEEEAGRWYRWGLLGNAVSVPVASWIGRRLTAPGRYNSDGDTLFTPADGWPNAAWNVDGRRSTRRIAAGVTDHPVQRHPGRISAFGTEHWPDLSKRALRGFTRRAEEGGLSYPPGFLDALRANLRQR